VTRRGGLYVVELGDAMIKVGATGAMSSRLKWLQSMTKLRAQRWAWIGYMKGNMLSAESVLLRAVGQSVPLSHGREWFSAGAGAFDAAVQSLALTARSVGVDEHSRLTSVMCGGDGCESMKAEIMRQLREQVAA